MSGVVRLLAMGCVCGRESVDIGGRRFYVRSRLGEGGFSYVDLVEDGNSHRKFALKRITCHSDTDQKVALTEVEYMRTLHHRNLLPLEVSDVHRMTDRSRSIISEVLIVMPFYRRGTLQDEFPVLEARGGHIELSRVLRLFKGICEGLKALHNNKPTAIAHRDLKPANVLLAEDDTPILMDFGSMGPARCVIKTMSEARQLQSLGCTLYAMCYHESPFDKTYQQGGSIALAVLGNNIKFPEAGDPYPQELRELILSMLVINADERPYVEAVISQAEVVPGPDHNQL